MMGRVVYPAWLPDPLLQSAVVRFRQKGARIAGLARTIWNHPTAQHVDDNALREQDIAGQAKHLLAHDALTSHRFTFGVDVCENKRFLPTFVSREHGIAPSRDCQVRDSRQTRTDRGRQRQWYKDFWHSQWQRLWRWWLCREVRTGRLTTPELSSRPQWNARLSSDKCGGRALGFVRSAPLSKGGA